MASLKVQYSLGYQAAILGENGVPPAGSFAQRVTSENRASNAGVVRMIARSDHWLGFDAGMGAALLNGDLGLAAGDEPPQDRGGQYFDNVELRARFGRWQRCARGASANGMHRPVWLVCDLRV